MRLFFIAISLCLFFSCNNDSTKESPNSEKDALIHFTDLSSEETGIDFINKVNEDEGGNHLTYDYFFIGAGVAMADFDNDGLTDLFFCGNHSPNQIYKNEGNLTFKNISETALPKSNKWSLGVSCVDINNDGFMDIYICNSGPDEEAQNFTNELLINNGDLTFTESAAEYGIDSKFHSVQSEFFDYDNDGDLDLWINNHGNSLEINEMVVVEKLNTSDMMAELNALKTKSVLKSKLQLFENRNNKFVDVSQEAGINTFAYGLGLSVADYNDDGLLDVYVANDFWVPDFYFENNGDGTFKNRMDKVNHCSYYSMGSDASDYNNDGTLDLVVVDMTPKDHYRNKTLMESMDTDRFYALTEYNKFSRQYMFNSFQVGVGDGFFSEIGNALDVSLTDWSWAPLLFDMNNNGSKDLYVTNGFFRDTKNQDYRERIKTYKTDFNKADRRAHVFEELKKIPSTPVRNQVFQNGSAFRYNNVTSSASNMEASFSNGAAYGDLDNDGDLDLVINNLNGNATLLRNDIIEQNFIKIKLQSKKESDYKHAKVFLYNDSQIQRKDYSFTRGYLSYVEQQVLFGIGKSSSIDSIKVIWPNNQISVIKNPEINNTLVFDYHTSNKKNKTKENPKGIFRDFSKLLSHSNVYHYEEFFLDFDKEILLPQKYSSLGPALAVGDINNDGINEFYLGGSKGYPGALLMLLPNGQIKRFGANSFYADKNYEDIDATFIDANGDGYMDIYVCSGGGSEITDSKFFQDRLYINQRNGDFIKSTDALPKINTSTAAPVAFDIDNDKDMDLFVGGRNAAGAYPNKAESYLLENVGGSFKNILNQKFQAALPNMVTDAEQTDLNGDGYLDLVISGEWSSPKFFFNSKQKSFNEKTYSNISKLNGWWYSVEKGDFNQDGKLDFVFGNLGENNKFHPSFEKPLEVLYDDFDEDGKQDIVLTKTYKDKIVPVRGKECSSEQMPIINEKFETYHDFASASIEDILGETKVQNSKKLTANYFKSVALINNGNGYDVKELPFQTQWSPILDMKVLDINKDQKMDIIYAGNIFETEPETPSYDAGKGGILYGNGDGTFSSEINIRKTGLNMNYNLKKLGLIKSPTGEIGIIGANNNNITQFFLYSNK